MDKKYLKPLLIFSAVCAALPLLALINRFVAKLLHESVACAFHKRRVGHHKKCRCDQDRKQ